MARRDDESLLDEMRETIRAERERAAARAGKQADAEPAREPRPAPARPGMLRRLVERKG